MIARDYGLLSLKCLLIWPFTEKVCWAYSRRRTSKLWFLACHFVIYFHIDPGGIRFETIPGILSLKNWETFDGVQDWPVGLILTASGPEWPRFLFASAERKEPVLLWPALHPKISQVLSLIVHAENTSNFPTWPRSISHAWISHLQLDNFVTLRFNGWEALSV